MPRAPALALAWSLFAPAAFGAGATIDVDALWDLARPALTEQRMRAVLAGARGDAALILHTQIARTHGLRRDFARARRILADIEPALAGAGAEARVRHALELGRTLCSAAHPPGSVSGEDRERARHAYLQAHDLARAAGLDGLAVDALHMMAFVDPAPEDAMRWTRVALMLGLSSSQHAARRWEASLRNNLGHELNRLGRHDEALAELRQAAALRERAGDAHRTRIAHWMVAHTLRRLQRHDEALRILQRLERENDAAGTPDPHVYDELALLYAAAGDAARAEAAATAAARAQAPGPR